MPMRIRATLALALAAGVAAAPGLARADWHAGQNGVEIEYDTTATPRPVVSLPAKRITGHTMPNVGDRNAVLWNLRSLPPSIR